MLAREYRLKDETEFEKVKTNGSFYQSENFGVRSLSRLDQDKPRFGFIISTKISKMAVHRNRIRRAFHEAIRQNMQIIPKGYSLVFLIKKGITKKTVEEIMTEIKDFLLEGKYHSN